MLRRLGFGLGLETFAKFLMISVSVSKNLVWEKKYLFWFRKICCRKKSLCIGVSQNFGIVIQCFPVHSPPPPFITKTREQTNKPTSSSL